MSNISKLYLKRISLSLYTSFWHNKGGILNFSNYDTKLIDCFIGRLLKLMQSMFSDSKKKDFITRQRFN